MPIQIFRIIRAQGVLPLNATELQNLLYHTRLDSEWQVEERDDVPTEKQFAAFGRAVRELIVDEQLWSEYCMGEYLKAAYAIDVAPLEKRIEELEEQTSAGQHEYRRQVRNAAMEEAAKCVEMYDQLVADRPHESRFVSDKIRALKEE
jgi:hypothetical protein